MQLVLPLLYILLCFAIKKQTSQAITHHLPQTASPTCTIEPAETSQSDNQCNLFSNNLGSLITFY